ncbi:MAG TPA: toprim domain-containing protein, partial [Candidatus Paceibacterota bacterium]
GIDKAKQDIRSKDYTILVEGQMDLVLSHQAGIRNTVAVSGTALADTLTTMTRDGLRQDVINNLGIVRRISKNIILAFDSDSAGRKAAMRSAGIALSLGMDVKIADLPEGKDPADLVLNNPEEWKNVLRKAKPVIEFQLDGVMNEVKEKKLDLRKIPTLLRERVLLFILSIEGSMERSHFIKMIGDRTGLSVEAIREDLNKINTNTPSGQEVNKNGIVSDIAQVSRLEHITRKLFGLLAYLDQKQSKNDNENIRVSIKRIAGDERYNNLIRDIEPYKNELILEAEILFGQNNHNWQYHVDELLLNFEEDVLRQDLSKAILELSQAEKIKSSEDSKDNLIKRCQMLALRISEISKKRNL